MKLMFFYIKIKKIILKHLQIRMDVKLLKPA